MPTTPPTRSPIRAFFAKVANVAVTTHTADATIIQTRHRIPEKTLQAGQVLVYQVPIPEPLRFLDRASPRTRKMHALEEYGLMHVKLYEDIAKHGRIATTYPYPVKVEGRYVMDPSPTPKFDNPKMHMSEALQLFGAGREKRIYAVPPHTEVVISISRTILSRSSISMSPARSAAPSRSISTRSSSMTMAGTCSSAPTPTIARTPRRRPPRQARRHALEAAE